MITTASQRDRLLDYLRERGDEGVTPMLALWHFSCFRLAARIWELRQLGHNIVDVGFVDGSGTRVARYVLLPPRPVAPSIETAPIWSD